MARKSSLDKMSYSELATLRTQIDRGWSRNKLRSASHCARSSQTWPRSTGSRSMRCLARAARARAACAVKYRDPKNPENTWTGRGRMPRWMVAATKGSKAKKEDFLI